MIFCKNSLLTENHNCIYLIDNQVFTFNIKIENVRTFKGNHLNVMERHSIFAKTKII